MIKIYHNSSCGRVALTLLLILGVLSFMTIPARANTDCAEECDSPLTQENHSYEPGLDKAMCPEPIADFCACPLTGCDSVLVYFTDLSQGYIDSWEWNFGDPASGVDNQSSDENPTHLYRQSGVYTVILTVTGPGGRDTMIKDHYITVKSSPVANFAYTSHQGCEANIFYFEDRSTDPLTWWWTFGDGGTSSEQNPTHTYAAPGIYTVTLKVTNECGRDIISRDVTVSMGDLPVADFISNATEGCDSAEITFIDRSHMAETWFWEFGDGTTSTEQNPTHTYTAAGKYSVTLTITNECGRDSITKDEFITIYKSPIADFSSDITETCVGAAVQFTDLSLYAVAWWWDFGDGTNSTEQNPVHNYSAPGVYTVSLKVYNRCGRDMKIRELYITVLPNPEADFTSDITEGCEGATVSFTDLSVNAETWDWEFGDGTTSTDQHPSHTYNVAGKYSVKLTVSNECGKDDTTQIEYITIHPKPIADFTSETTQGCTGKPIAFTDLSLYAETWLWEFGDGSTSIEQNPSHSYAAAGTYDVKLTVTNRCGEDDITKMEYISIYPEPIADFEAEYTGVCKLERVYFLDRSQHAMSWDWDFGDGSTSSDRNPSHAYSATGKYTVTLTVSNPCGDDDTVKTDYITIITTPTADFTADKTEGCFDTEVTFTNLTTDAYSWDWDFGDGSTSVEENPSHTYTKPGKYTVTLTAYNTCGPDDETKIEYITIYGGPIADFDSRKEVTCNGSLVFFTDKSTDAEIWSWDFGDGWTSGDPNPTHLYTSGGIFTVTLIVTNRCGVDTTTGQENIILIPPPMADFSSELTEICEGGEVDFTNLSLNAYSYLWNFGDGQTSTDENPSHTYNTAGKYDVSLIAYNECGDDTATKSEFITVQSGPTADFEALPTQGEAALTVDFSDLSISAFGIDIWLWDFGDGQTSDLQNPSHVYTLPGYYTVKLTVTDKCGPDDETKEEYIYVVDTCSVDFFAEPTEGCAELTVYFGGTTKGPCEISSWTWDFGDPTSGNDNTATGQNVEHIYKTGGVYTVTLTAEDVSGTKIVTKTDYITVNDIPTADFSASPTEGVASLFVDFTDLSQSSTPILTWEWNFGDPTSGTANSSTDQNPDHIYNTEGTYNVTLIATNICGPDTAYGEINVSPAITITKEVDKPAAILTDELLYTLTVKNNSANTIDNILVIDSIPDSTYFVPGSITGAGLYNSFENQVTWNLMAVTAGAEIEVSFKVVIIGPIFQSPTIISNQAMAVIDEEPSKVNSPRTFWSNIVTTIVDRPTGLMEIEKDVSASLASPGDLLTYSLTVTNRNPIPTDSVMIFDAIPDLTSYASVITGGGTHDPGNDSLVWNLGTMAAFESQTVSFQVTVDPQAGDGQKIPNTAMLTSTLGDAQSNEVITAISLTPIVVTKAINKPSGMIGDLVRYTITVENYSDDVFNNVLLTDTMPGGIFYVDGTTLLDGGAFNDPIGDNPLEWILGDLPASGTFTLQYTAQIGASAHPGINENIARAQAFQSGQLVNSNRAIAQIFVLGYTLTGSIRGRVIVDCDGDGIAESDSVPSGMDVYLDDGSQSRVNKEGMFYFSTVRPGERVVALDERDLNGYYVPDEAQASVFVHVHETGESYVIFRICPEYPILDINKKASIIPTVKVTKTAQANPVQNTDSLGVLVDYEIDIKSNGLANPTRVMVVDSMPAETKLLLDEQQTLKPKQNGSQLIYEVTAAQERLNEKVAYSLRDLSPGTRPYITNKVFIEGAVAHGDDSRSVFSDPLEVSVGPLLLAPPQPVKITLTPALFITSKADLQEPAIPLLHAVADSIMRYADADIKVEGHTDYRRIHTIQFPSNWELGEARAKAVVDWLVDNREIERDRLAFESFAATRPVVFSGTTSKELQPNRRTEVIIQARVAGFFGPSVKPSDKWEKSTLLTLEPISFDTVYEASQAPVEIGLDDSWEVILTVENTSTIAAENSSLTDVLPEGVEYIANSATIDGMPITAEVSGNTLKLLLEKIEPEQVMELRYRIRALPDTQPSGGGAASIEVMTSENLPVIQKSNEVRFR